MRSNHWVAFPEVAEATEGQIAVGYTGMANAFDSESLELNVAALRSGVIGWGGYSALTLAAYAGDTDQYGFSAQSVAGDGTATASGAMSISRAETSSSNPLSEAFENRNDIRNGSLSLQWNINALNQRLELHEQLDPVLRARQLDKEVRKQAVKGVFRHNVTEVIHDHGVLLTPITGFLDLALIVEVVNNFTANDSYESAKSIGFRLVLTQIGLPILRTIGLRHNGEYDYKDFITDPVFFAARPIRASMAAGILASSKLVRAAS